MADPMKSRARPTRWGRTYHRRSSGSGTGFDDEVPEDMGRVPQAPTSARRFWM